MRHSRKDLLRRITRLKRVANIERIALTYEEYLDRKLLSNYSLRELLRFDFAPEVIQVARDLAVDHDDLKLLERLRDALDVLDHK